MKGKTFHNSRLDKNIGNIIINLESKKQVAGLYLEISQAFVTVNQEKLLMQLRKVWSSWPGLGVVKKLGGKKKPLCTRNKFNCDPTEIKYGEPLGSVLDFPFHCQH